MLADALLASGNVIHVTLDTQFLAHALLSGTRAFLRGADALYVATSELYNTRLISWDQELVQRATALTPREWLISNP
jgi:predicted nucleic acid-binding protein